MSGTADSGKNRERVWKKCSGVRIGLMSSSLLAVSTLAVGENEDGGGDEDDGNHNYDSRGES